MTWNGMPWWERLALVAIAGMIAWNVLSGRVHLPDLGPAAIEQRVNSLEDRVEDLEAWR